MAKPHYQLLDMSVFQTASTEHNIYNFEKILKDEHKIEIAESEKNIKYVFKDRIGKGRMNQV